MGGGLMQLVAYGAQDIYLTGNPQITFFKVVYRRHTNFSMESIEQTFNGSADFGKKVTCTISRNGDLISRVYLQVTLPRIECSDPEDRFRWLNWIGHTLIRNVEVEIGGQRIDKHYGDWLHIWNELSQTTGHQVGYANMVGNVPRLTQVVSGQGGPSGQPPQLTTDMCNFTGCIPETTLYIPLQFWFCRNPGLALPLIALQYHEVKINLEFRNARECYWGTGRFANEMPSLRAASLYVDYIYLDTDERRRFAQVSHEYLIEQLQFTGDESVHAQSNKIKLNFNHPCKELVWVCQPDSNVDINSTRNFGGPQWFNYSDAIDSSYYTGTVSDPLGGGMAVPAAADPLNLHALPLSSNATGLTRGAPGVKDGIRYPLQGGFLQNGAGVCPGPGISAAGECEDDCPGVAPNMGGIAGLDWIQLLADQDVSAWKRAPSRYGVEPGVPQVSGQCGQDADTGVFAGYLPMFDFGSNPVLAAKLQLNGHDRFSEREGRYFNLVQPYQHHENVPATGINVYSFGLKPEEHQPSGTCNMSRIDNATLHLTLTREAVMNNRSCKVRVYATNYNVLRIMSGMGGLAYSN